MTETSAAVPAAPLRTVDGVLLPAPGTYAVDVGHSAVLFAVRHLGLSRVRGIFGAFEGVVEIADRPEASSVRVDVDVASVDTRLAPRDERLRGEDFFDAARHPTMTFRSTRVAPASASVSVPASAPAGDRWAVEGDLTIRGVTQPVTLDVRFEGGELDPFGGRRIAFTASGEVDRERWGISWNQVLDSGGLFVGRTVTLDLEVEAVLRDPA